MAPRGPQESPKTLQDGKMLIFHCFCSHLGGTKSKNVDLFVLKGKLGGHVETLKTHPRRAQDAPRCPQDGPNTVQDGLQGG